MTTSTVTENTTYDWVNPYTYCSDNQELVLSMEGDARNHTLQSMSLLRYHLENHELPKYAFRS